MANRRSAGGGDTHAIYKLHKRTRAQAHKGTGAQAHSGPAITTARKFLPGARRCTTASGNQCVSLPPPPRQRPQIKSGKNGALAHSLARSSALAPNLKIGVRGREIPGARLCARALSLAQRKFQDVTSPAQTCHAYFFFFPFHGAQLSF